MNNKQPKLGQLEFINCIAIAKERVKSAEILLNAGQYRDSISRYITPTSM